MKDRLLRYEIAEDLGGEGGEEHARVKVLLIGLGRWGEKHLRVLGELGCEVWVADVSAERRAFAVKTGVPEARAVADFRAALPHVDAVDLVTPADNHLALASECLLAGKDCFVEKPLTLTAAEGRELAQVVRSTGARAPGRPHLPLPPGDAPSCASGSGAARWGPCATARGASRASSGRARTWA